MSAQFIFATHNENKLKEVRQLIPPSMGLLSLHDVSLHEDIEETADTLEGNALIKARYVYEKTGIDCFADDSGLEVDALNGAPGVYSARYAGEEKNNERNMEKLLRALEDADNRSAQFRTVIALIAGGKEFLFEGIIRGRIATQRSGEQGFGYDPVFIPENHGETFAQMGSAAKNAISHRAIAIHKLILFLKEFH